MSGTSVADDMGVAEEIDLRTRVAILPMVVNSVGEDGYLRSGLSDMLASRLGQNPNVAVIRIEAVSQATTDPARAASIGLENDAHYVVFGSFTQFGQGASLDVQCVEARATEDIDPEARRVFIQSGTVGEIIPKLDETAQKIGLFVGGADTPAVGAAPAAAPTRARVQAPVAPAAPDPEVAELRRRMEAIEAYLFGEQPGESPEAKLSPDASQDFRLR